MLRDSDGAVTGGADVFHSSAEPRILRDCFVSLASNVLGVVRTSACDPVILHADGSRVTQSSPASEGEALVIYLYGLAVPYASEKTGASSGVPVDASTSYSMNYKFGANLVLSFDDDQTPLNADYIGTAPSEVGLYQANIRVPRIPEGLPPCQLTQRGNYAPRSNFSVGLRLRAPSDLFHRSDRLPFDWAGICVDPASRRPD